MKKPVPIICIVVLLSIMLVGFVYAGNSAYSITEAPAVAPCTVDGRWTTTDEWKDATSALMGGTTNGVFEYDVQDFTGLGLEWLVEIFTDNTNDTGDYWQICFDDSNSGGSVPSAGDFMIEITGHTTLKVYQGSGTGWTQVTPASGEILWANTIGTSAWNDTSHWILEVVDSSKIAGTVQIPNQPPTGLRVAAYDASTGKTAAWAPGSTADNPNGWGVISGFSMDPIPEGLNVAAVAMLSSVVILAAVYLVQKRSASA